MLNSCFQVLNLTNITKLLMMLLSFQSLLREKRKINLKSCINVVKF